MGKRRPAPRRTEFESGMGSDVLRKENLQESRVFLLSNSAYARV
jgi:hypothetical protein